jgi:RNA ligase
MWESGLTPVLEWTSPDNQIVVAYERPELRVLCVRENETGRLRDDLMGDLGLDVVQRHDVPHGPGTDPTKVIEALRARTHEEGAILRVGQNFGKIKCEWYGNLHHLLSNTGFQRRHLARVVLDDQLDDLMPFLGESRRAEAESFVEAMWDGVGRIAGEVTDLVSQARAAHGEDRKAIATQFAPGIKCPRAKMFFFMVLRGDEVREKIMEYLSEETIRDHRWVSVEEWLGIAPTSTPEPEMMP